MQSDRLSDVLSEFARTLLTDFPIQSILDKLVVSTVEVMPVSAAGVTLVYKLSDPSLVAASDVSALRYERLQFELAEGPCHTAIEQGEAVSIPDLRTDDRYPAFARGAAEVGLEAVFAFPLRCGDTQFGSLDLYRGTPGGLSVEEMATGQTLADVAAAYLNNAQSLVELREMTERALATSLHDPLTGLPNRNLLIQRLEHAILRCRRSRKTVAVFYLDLDGFKSVNDTYGHQVGDELLVAVGERLTRLLRPGDTVARLAGDEFVIVCEDLDSAPEFDSIAFRIDAALAEPFPLSSAEVNITGSVGIAFAGLGDSAPDDILEDADMAMYEAKRAGGGAHAVMNLREPQASRRSSSLTQDLQRALAGDGLRNVYQPILATSDRRITGVETLLRWTHPRLGVVPPATIVPMAEQAGLITEVGQGVLERACRDLQQWRALNHDLALDVAVNISVQQLMSLNFTATVADVLADTGTDPASVTLELTESMFVQDGKRAVIVLRHLKDLGVRLSLDDFGTGYSSLVHLMRFPVDILKIDRSLVAELDREPASRLIVKAVVDLAHDLGLTVVAEGVETLEQFEAAADLGCDACQGFYFSHPVTADGIGGLVAQPA